MRSWPERFGMRLMADFHDEVRQNIDTMPVQVATAGGCREFASLSEARKEFPSLDPFHNGKEFTWAMRGSVGGQTAMRFDDWATYRILST